MKRHSSTVQNFTEFYGGGYIFDQTPVPEHTLGPMVPDSDAHLFSFGIGYTRNRFTIDMRLSKKSKFAFL